MNRGIALALAGVVLFAQAPLKGRTDAVPAGLAPLLAELREADARQGTLPDDRRLPAILTRLFRLEGDLAAGILQGRPGLDARGLARALEALTRAEPEDSAGRLSAQVLPLGIKAWVLYLEHRTTGTLVVLDRGPEGAWRVAWRLLDQARVETRDALGHWALLEEAGYHAGPLYGRLHRLPPDARGAPRFLVFAGQHANGACQVGQVGIWAWREGRAEPVLLEYFSQTADAWQVRLRGNRITVATKESLRTIYSAACDPEPQATWTVDVTADGVHDRGRRWAKPELKDVDELFFRVGRRLDTADLAAPEVRLFLERRIPRVKAPSDTGDLLPFGMLGGVRRTVHGRRTTLDLAFDDGSMRLVLERRGGRPFFVAVAGR